MVAALLSAGANIETRDNSKRTPLHYAAREGHVDVVAALLEAGADIEAMDFCGKMPRDYAKANKHYKIANMLK